MKRNILLLFFGLTIQSVYSQNKKEQIEALNFSVDSLKTVLTTVRLTYSDSLEKERKISSQQKLLINEQQKEKENTMLELTNYKAQISVLTNEEVLLKKEIEDFKTKLYALNNSEIQSCNVYKNDISSFLLDYFKSTLLKNPDSEMSECQMWWQGNVPYALVITKDVKQLKAEFDDEMYPEISLNYYILKYSNGKFEKEYNWREKVNVCPVDSDNKNIDFRITDLNRDGQYEIWTVNENYCKGDVSPNNLNIYMYEKSKLYSMKSVTNIPSMEITDTEIKEWMKGGDTNFSINQFDVQFESISQQYKDFAIKIRNENILGADKFNFALD
jgi:hypothetical protein